MVVQRPLGPRLRPDFAVLAPLPPRPQLRRLDSAVYALSRGPKDIFFFMTRLGVARLHVHNTLAQPSPNSASAASSSVSDDKDSNRSVLTVRRTSY